jgi:hypothetical protein
MSTETIGLLGVLGTLLGSLLAFFLTRIRNGAEIEKFKAEAERARVETEKIRRELHPSPGSTQPNTYTASSSCEITVLAAERSHLSQYYVEQASSAVTIDIMALTLHSALENFGEGKFIQWIQTGKKIRILILSPYSAAAKLRSREESSNEGFLPAKIMEQVEALKRLYARAEKQLKSQDYTGSLEVRLFDDLPYFSCFHTDKVMVMGLYYGHIRGLQSEALLIDEKSSMHAKMHDHFNYLWNRAGKRGAPKMVLCSIAKGRTQFNHALLETFQPPTQ